MILSASGWRGIFSETLDEESPSGAISPSHRVIAAGAAKVFADYIGDLGRNGDIILGRDTRPTGEALAQALLQALLGLGKTVRYLGVSAAPEIMAYARSLGDAASGFVYISASHNPIGHNGFKFGLADGGVLPGSEAAVLIKNFRELMASPDCARQMEGLLNNADQQKLAAVPALRNQYKEEAKKAYLDFTAEVVSGFSDKAKSGEALEAIAACLKERPLGIAADFNGSARTVSIDREFLQSIGVRFEAINDKPGEIRHRIVPEGESLEPCRSFLDELHEKDPSYTIGYVPDCDGDRGNLVVWDEGEKKARALEAQEVFALACMAELAYLAWTGELKYDNKGNAMTRAALAVNDPTSLRVDRIALAFDIPVFRAEVGEANVVGLARKLREQGYLVRILGEGSAGGNITHPSAVRDPIDTVAALLKLLTIRSIADRKGLYELWCDLSDQAETYREDFTLADVIASLPAFQTTGAYSEEAVLKVKTADHGLLKDRYQGIFLKEWEEHKEQLKARYGIVDWDATAYNGTEERRGIARFGEAGKGGLKVAFINKEGRKTACIWMRGSGTEPVFRVMADAEGSDKRLERSLIEWQRRMVEEADR
ncbi:phosphohexose mutase family protein [Leadbettera azotonutricia ZAS-9]|uniref:Phosphohexose mutase family protein n=2 Tax=Leadbettera azotonutricia TaxID=150829 RepID=F5YE73_LEAAZ|nr:phosphohexose mutase family protein [Leadbettera azotonutricia ZAS-9]